MKREIEQNVLLFWGTAMLLAGCQAIQPDNISKFSQGVSQTQQQMDTAFSAANDLAREQSIAYIISTTKPGLSEADFTPALSADAIAQWDSAFSKIEAYTSALGILLSGNDSAQFSNAMVNLGTELKSGIVNANVSPGVATAFTQLGSALLSIKDENDAQAAMQQADPAIRQTLTQMADAVGADNKTGIRGTVWSNWEVKLATGPVHDYAQAVTNGNNVSQKRTIAESYVTMLGQRDAQLSSLASLRQSFLSLADAHTAASKGSAADVTTFITIINNQLAQTQLLLSKFKTIQGTASSPSNQ